MQWINGISEAVCHWVGTTGVGVLLEILWALIMGFKEASNWPMLEAEEDPQYDTTGLTPYCLWSVDKVPRRDKKGNLCQYPLKGHMVLGLIFAHPFGINNIQDKRGTETSNHCFALTQRQGRIFEDVPKCVAGIPADFHSVFTLHCRDQGMYGFLNGLAEPGISNLWRLQKMKEVSKGTDSIAFHLEERFWNSGICKKMAAATAFSHRFTQAVRWPALPSVSLSWAFRWVSIRNRTFSVVAL